MPDDSLLLLGALALASGLLAVVRGWLSLSSGVNAELFESVLLRLLGRGELQRTRLVLRAAPKALYPRLVSAALASLDALPNEHPEVLARSEMLESVRRERERELERQRLAPWADLLQIALAMAALGLAWRAGLRLPTWGYVAAGVGVLGALFVAQRRRKLMALTPERLAPIVDALLRARSGPSEPGPYRAAAAAPENPDGELWVHAWRGEALCKSARIGAGEVLKIGRLASAGLVLDDPDVARLHAVIEHGIDETKLIDLGSEAGVLVNGQRANLARVGRGDRIEIGPFRLELGAQPVDAPPRPEAKPKRRCAGCGAEALEALEPLPADWAAASVRAEHCQRCGKIELFKSTPAD